MFSRLFYRKALIISVSIGVILLLQASLTVAADGPETTDDGAEVMTRGPIHEAFADVSVDETQPGAVISRPAPDPINEVPPDHRPEGDQVMWISGYWSWDEDQNDFIWVSGIWRDMPPGRQWIPGYWRSVANGNQYVSGYWNTVEQKETVYLPPPPQPVVAAPSSPQISPNHVWTDGHWIWHTDRYAWQAGYWVEQRPDMIWIPAHYVWTPRGYIFVRGFWDYQLPRRGVMFAPVYYSRPIYRNYGYYHRPSIVLSTDAVFLSVFIRRDSHHYYFGDYYDRRYERRGYYPWFSKHATRQGHDHSYRNYRSYRLRTDRDWEHKYQREFEYRRSHVDARPPHFYRAQRDHGFDRSRGQKDPRLGRRFDEVVKSHDQPVRFTRLNQEHRREFESQDGHLRNFQKERRNLEMAPPKNGSSRQRGEIKRPERVTMPESPIKDRRESQREMKGRQNRQDDRRRGGPDEKAAPRQQAEPQDGKPNQKKNSDSRNQTEPQGVQSLQSQSPEHTRIKRQSQPQSQPKSQQQSKGRQHLKTPEKKEALPASSKPQGLQPAPPREQSKDQRKPQSQDRQRMKSPQKSKEILPQTDAQGVTPVRKEKQTRIQPQPQRQVQPQAPPQDRQRLQPQKQREDMEQQNARDRQRLQPQKQAAAPSQAPPSSGKQRKRAAEQAEVPPEAEVQGRQQLNAAPQSQDQPRGRSQGNKRTRFENQGGDQSGTRP